MRSHGVRQLCSYLQTTVFLLARRAELVSQARNVDIALARDNSVSVIRADVSGRADDLTSYGSSAIVTRRWNRASGSAALTETLLVAERVIYNKAISFRLRRERISMNNQLSRRNFVGGAVGSALASQAAGASNNTLPTACSYRSGERVTILAIGCGNRLWAAYKTEDRGVEAVNLAWESGIRYFDTAQGYGNGMSETWVGKALKDHRKEVFLATKTGAQA